MDITALSEISRIREVLEPLAARVPAERRGSGARRLLEELQDGLTFPDRDGRGHDEALRRDIRIHRAVHAAAGDTHLRATLDRYSSLATRNGCVVADRMPQLHEHVAVHTALLTAVLDGEAEEASDIMVDPVRDFETQIRQVLRTAPRRRPGRAFPARPASVDWRPSPHRTAHLDPGRRMPNSDARTDDRSSTAPVGWSTLHRHHIGIDVGGTAIKYAVMDMAKGMPTTPVLELPTPVPATPDAVAETLTDVVAQLSSRPHAPDPQASIGVALPAIVRHGIARSAANIDRSWLGLDVRQFFTERLRRTVHVLNDADAAGLAELHYGSGRGEAGRPATGTVLVITLGAGIGSALIVDGKLVPNLELGHLELGGVDVDTWASALARERDRLDWPAYAERLQQYLSHLEFLFSPDLIIVGGGISAQHEAFLPHLALETRIVPAALRNTAGIIGAARHAYLAVPPLE